MEVPEHEQESDHLKSVEVCHGIAGGGGGARLLQSGTSEHIRCCFCCKTVMAGSVKRSTSDMRLKGGSTLTIVRVLIDHKRF